MSKLSSNQLQLAFTEFFSILKCDKTLDIYSFNIKGYCDSFIETHDKDTTYCNIPSILLIGVNKYLKINNGYNHYNSSQWVDLCLSQSNLDREIEFIIIFEDIEDKNV